MEKLVVFAVIILVISCNLESSNKTQISTAKVKEDALQIAAKKVFTPLPAFAENKENILTEWNHYEGSIVLSFYWKSAQNMLPSYLNYSLACNHSCPVFF